MPFTIPNTADAGFAPQADPDKVDIDMLVGGLSLTGVVSGCAVTAQAVPDMTVAVAAGVVRLGSTTVTVVVAGGNVAIPAADAVNPRFDLIVANSAGVLSAISGIAAASPAFPAIPAGSVALASVYVPALDAAIQANQITDKRVPVSALAGLVLLGEVELGAASAQLDLVGIPGGFKDLILRARLRSDRASTADGLALQLGGAAAIDATAGNYRWHHYILGDTNTEASGFTSITLLNLGGTALPGATATAGAWGQLELTILDYANLAYNRQVMGQAGVHIAGGTRRMSVFHGEWIETANPVARLRLLPVNGPNLIAGSKVRLYGAA